MGTGGGGAASLKLHMLDRLGFTEPGVGSDCTDACSGLPSRRPFIPTPAGLEQAWECGASYLEAARLSAGDQALSTEASRTAHQQVRSGVGVRKRGALAVSSIPLLPLLLHPA